MNEELKDRLEQIYKDPRFVDHIMDLFEQSGNSDEMLEYLRTHPEADVNEVSYMRLMLLSCVLNTKENAERIRKHIENR